MAGSRQTLIAAIAAGVAAALLAGVGIGWLVRGGEVGRLKERVSDLESGSRQAGSQVDTSTVEPTSSVPPAEATTRGDTTPADSGASADRETPTGPTERQPGYVKSVVNSAGNWVLTIDYIQFLTGGEAAEAAAAHGDESPPPNDYYIVNDNPKLREFPVQAGIGVIVVTNTDGTSDSAGHAMSVSEWAAALSGAHAEVFKSNPYWVTVTNGTITAIEAQYVP